MQMSQGYAVVQGKGLLTYKMPFSHCHTRNTKGLWVKRVDKILRYVTPLLIILVLAFAVWYWVAGISAPHLSPYPPKFLVLRSLEVC